MAKPKKPTKPAWKPGEPVPTGWKLSPNGKRIVEKGKKAKEKGDSPGGGLPSPGSVITPVIPKVHEVAEKFDQIGDKAFEYGTDNPYSQAALPYIQKQLAGDMSANPWESDLYGDIGGKGHAEWEAAMQALMGYAGVGNGNGGGGRTGTGGAGAGGRNVRYSYSPNASGGINVSGSSSSRGGSVPDTVGPSDSFFATQIKALFDPATIDPMNDPTMQPLLEATRTEQAENFYSLMRDLDLAGEGSGVYGTGGYASMQGRAREESQESLDQAVAALLGNAREQAMARRMEGLQQTNVRDIAAMNDLTQRYGIDQSAAAAGAGAGAAAADAAEGRKLQALSLLLGSSQDMLGLRSGLAGLRQNSAQGALTAGQGYAGLGLEGMNLGMQGQQGRLGSYGLLGDIAQGIGNYQLGKGQLGIQQGQLGLARQQATQESLLNLLEVMERIGRMGGTNTTLANGQALPGGINPNLAGLLSGLGAGINTWAGLKQGDNP